MRRSNWSVGAVTAVLVAALVTAGGAGPALADTSYPSWGDVQAAKELHVMHADGSGRRSCGKSSVVMP